jgi:hypothetical protein
VVARDTDALLMFLTDRPSLCDAQVDQPECRDAWALAAPAHCDAPYDPCQVVALPCQCQIPLLGLCPGGHAQVTPVASGWNGMVGSAPDATPFDLSMSLPRLVLNEIMLAPTGVRAEGAYIELVNLGSTAIDLLGIILADCRGTQGCAVPKATQSFEPFIPGGSSTLAPKEYALLVDRRFQASSIPDLPTAVLLLAPVGGAPLFHLATNAPQPLGIFQPGGGPALSTFDGAVAVVRGFSLERIDPYAPDPWPDNWAVGAAAAGTPGLCNSVTSAANCPEGE